MNVAVELSPLESTIAATPPEKLRSDCLAFAAGLDADYKADCSLWLREQVITKDEATQVQLPWPEKPYLEDALSILLDPNERAIGFPKSRRVMVSWLVAAWITHRARYFDNNAIFVVSDTEAKSAFITDQRCAFIEDHLRTRRLRRPYRSVRTKDGLIGRIEYLGTKSYIWAVAAGEDVTRGYTPSILFLDESDKQERGNQTLGSVLAFIEQGKPTKLVLASTSNGPIGPLAGICKQIGLTRFGA